MRRFPLLGTSKSSTGALLAALVLALGAPAPSAGQAPQDSVLLQGRVVAEEGGAGIAYVDVRVYDRDLRFLAARESGRDGRFSVVVRDEPGVYIEIKRIGYETTETPFLWFDGHDFFELELRMARDAVLLAPLEVVARERAPSPVLEDFRHRIELGSGWYLTREDIRARNVSRTTDLVAEAPGVRLSSSGMGLRRVVQMVRGGARAHGCPVQVYLDGMRLNQDNGPAYAQVVAIDDYVSPESVAGIEVYRGIASVPAQFLNDWSQCGVVAIWTRRGGDDG